MPSLAVSLADAPLRRRLQELLHQVEHLEPAMEDIADYMVRSTKTRIYRGGPSPDGDEWAPLSEETTVYFKGHSRPLIDSGELVHSIEVDSVDDTGFVISADADHASYMQEGVRRTSGRIPGKRVPARPFMGFSQTNLDRIRRMLIDHLAAANEAE